MAATTSAGRGAPQPHPFRRHLPTAEQELMLAAAIGTGDVAIESWHRWRRSIDLDDITGAEARVIPLAFRNLSAAGVIEADPDAGRLRGIYRRSWVRNQLQLRAAARLIRALGAAGVEVLALKGVAMNCLYYEDGGVRTMNDIDLLVRPTDLEVVGLVLAELGYRSPGADLDRAIGRKHALGFRSEEGLDLDLHWYSLVLSGDDAEFWSGSVEVEIAGETARALCPTDQLLHTLVHGACDAGSFTWVPDAVEVLSGSAIDWERFRTVAARRNLTVIATAMLRYLSERGWAAVPAEELERLAALEAPAWERRGFRALTAPMSPVRTFRVAQERRRRMGRSLPPDQVPGPYAVVDGLYEYRPPGRLFFDGARSVARYVGNRFA